MVHSRAKLTPFGRLLLVDRVEALGWTVAAACEALGVSNATGHKWVRRYRQEGAGGLDDRTSRPRHSPRRLSASAEQRILRNRRRLRSAHTLWARGWGTLVPQSTKCFAGMAFPGSAMWTAPPAYLSGMSASTQENSYTWTSRSSLAYLKEAAIVCLDEREAELADLKAAATTTSMLQSMIVHELPTSASLRTSAAPQRPDSYSMPPCSSPLAVSASSECLLTAP